MNKLENQSLRQPLGLGRGLFIFLLSGLISGCGVGLEDTTGPNVDRLIKNEKNQKEYAQIQGVYEGEVGNDSTGLAPFPVKLSLYVDTVQDTIDSDLQPAPRVVLRGRLQRDDFVGESDNLVLIGSYNSVTGELDLQPDTKQEPRACSTGSRMPLSVKGTVRGSRVVATILREGRIWGYADVVLKSRDVRQQAEIGGIEDFNRLRATYARVQGTYLGQLERRGLGDTVYSEAVRVLVYFVESREGTDQSDEPCYRPRLNLRFIRDKQGEFADVLFQDVRYSPEANLITARAPASANRGAFEIRARLGSGLNADLYSDAGLWGRITMNKTSPDAILPEGSEEEVERARRQRTFAEVIGNYIGHLDPGTGETPKPVELIIYAVEEESGRTAGGDPVFLPSLRARYVRLDLDNIALDHFMSVRYDVEGGVRKLAMTSLNGGDGSVPGAGTFSISARFDGSTIRGPASDHRGPQGTIIVRRER